MKNVFWVRPDAAEVGRRKVGVAGWIWVWLPAVVACMVIFGESTRTMSASHTSSWLRPWFERVFGPVSNRFWGELHHLFRKSGHFLGYGTVCLTFLRGWLLSTADKLNWTLEKWRGRACVAAVGCTTVVASLDEWHQTMLPGRSGLLSDVVLDTCGGIVMCGVLSGVWWARRER